MYKLNDRKQVMEMEQPKIRLFDKVWNVKEVEFDEEGKLIKIIYYEYHGWTRLVLEYKQVDYGQGPIEVIEPLIHPHEDFVIVPSLNDIIV